MCKDAVHHPMYPESTSIDFRCVPTMKPAPKTEAPEVATRPLSWKGWSVFQSVICAMPWGWQPVKNCLFDCYSPMGL